MSHERPAAFLGASSNLPLDRPFSAAEARDAGIDGRRLQRWRDEGLVISPVRGAYYVAQLDDDLSLRAACLRLVAPDDAVVTDHTAAWLHGAPMVLPANAHLEVPPVAMYLPPGRRLRNKLADSGERSLLAHEVTVVDGIAVTTLIRTMCDLGRRRHHGQAFEAMCAVANVPGVDLGAFRREADSPRFHGYRWVRTLRAWAPHVVRGTQSPGECGLLRQWIDCSDLPYPRIQIPVPGPRGHELHLDVGCPELRYAAEYDGPRWHGPDRRQHDADRRGWLEQEHGWIIDVFTAQDVYGPCQPAAWRLREGIGRARRRAGSRAWHGQDRAS